MKQSFILWIIAFLLTAASAVYQRVTGPTYPISGTARLGATEITYRLERAHGGESDARVVILVSDPAVRGTLRWKRFKTNDTWTAAPMERGEVSLGAALPHQPPAGKLEYQVQLTAHGESISLPPDQPAVIRFRGDVPLWILIPHVLAMFTAMLLSTRTGLEVFSGTPSYRRRVSWTLAVLFAGGLILGPIMQWYAFGAFWTGWPLGTDLTDNKTAAAFFGWVVAAVAIRRTKRPARWVVGAAVLLLAVYMIPHSVLGSELNYNDLPTSSPSP